MQSRINEQRISNGSLLCFLCFSQLNNGSDFDHKTRKRVVGLIVSLKVQKVSFVFSLIHIQTSSAAFKFESQKLLHKGRNSYYGIEVWMHPSQNLAVMLCSAFDLSDQIERKHKRVCVVSMG